MFGGDWTKEKLERVRQYLTAYTKIMRKKDYQFGYIDAFAGTGYLALKDAKAEAKRLFPELMETEARDFVEGSAHVALEVEPPFEKYIFIEKQGCRSSELQRLRDEFPAKANDIVIVQAEANTYLQDLCRNRVWKKHRAVLFLDPYGMQVEWETMKAIAKTRAIDLWLLFPLGVAVNRLLRRDGLIDEGWRHRLDLMFGDTGWFSRFYNVENEQTFFGPEQKAVKTADAKAIGRYFVERLQSVFPGVAKNPLALSNTKNCPLYLLCFATANPDAATLAVKIAQAILRGPRIR